MADENDFPDAPSAEEAAISAEAKNDFTGEEPGVEDVIIEPKAKRGRKPKLTLAPKEPAAPSGHSVRELRQSLGANAGWN